MIKNLEIPYGCTTRLNCILKKHYKIKRLTLFHVRRILMLHLYLLILAYNKFKYIQNYPALLIDKSHPKLTFHFNSLLRVAKIETITKVSISKPHLIQHVLGEIFIMEH